nr:hypothetical protein [Streptomyces sp. CLI2509]
MIVRIMGEGQFALAESHLAELNTLDEELLAEMENGDGPQSPQRDPRFDKQ